MKAKTFIKHLKQQLENLKSGEVEIDNEDGWLKLTVGDMEFEIGFDKDYNIDTIGLYKGEDCDRVWAVFKPQTPKKVPTQKSDGRWSFPIGWCC